MKFALVLLLIAGCTGVRTIQREESSHEVLQAHVEARAEERKQAHEEHVVVADTGPVHIVEDTEVIVPRAGKPPLRLRRHREEDRGPSRVAEVRDETNNAASIRGVKADVASRKERQAEEHSETHLEAGPGWKVWVGVGVAVALVGALAWFLRPAWLRWKKS